MSKKEKVLILGLAKSGTTILTYKIKDSFPNQEESLIIFEPKSRNHQEEVEYNTKHIVTKVLLPNAFNEVNIAEKLAYSLIEDYKDYHKKIFIARDPRDVLLSSLLYAFYKPHGVSQSTYNTAITHLANKEKNRYSVSMHTMFMDCFKDFYLRTKDYYDMVADIVSFIRDKHGFFILKYEDMIEGNFSELNKYLGFEVAAKTDKVPNELNRVERSKSSNNWREFINPFDIIVLKKVLSKYMGEIGYDINDWNLSDNKTLAPINYSEYVKRIWNGNKNK